MAQLQIPRPVRAEVINDSSVVQTGRPGGDQFRIIYNGQPRVETQIPRSIPRTSLPTPDRNFFPTIPDLPELPGRVREVLTTAEHHHSEPLRFGEARDDKFVDEFRKQARQPVSNVKVFGFEKKHPHHLQNTEYDPHYEEKQKIFNLAFPQRVDYVPGTATFLGPEAVGDKPWVSVRTVDGNNITVDILTGRVFGSNKICNISPFEYVKQIKDFQDNGLPTNMMKLSTYIRPDEEYFIPYIVVKRENYLSSAEHVPQADYYMDCDGEYSLDDYLTNDWKSEYFKQSLEEVRIDLANVIIQGNIANGNDILDLFDLYHSTKNEGIKMIIGFSLMLLPHLEKSASNYLKNVTVLHSIKHEAVNEEFNDKMQQERKNAMKMTLDAVTSAIKTKIGLQDIINEHQRDSEFWLLVWEELYRSPEKRLNDEHMARCIIDIYPRLLENYLVWEYYLLHENEPTTETISLIEYAIEKVDEKIPNIIVDKINPEVARIFEKYGYIVKERKSKHATWYIILKAKDYQEKRQNIQRSKRMQDQKISHSIAPYLEKLTRDKMLTVEESINFDRALNRLTDTFYVDEKYIHLFNPFDEKSLYHDPFLEKLHSLDIVPVFKTSKM